MNLSKMDWLNRIIYIGFGTLLGATIQWLPNSNSNNHSQKKESTITNHTFDINKSQKTNNPFDFEKVVTQAVRAEMIAQLAAIKLNQQLDCPHTKENKIDEKNSNINAAKIETHYNAANQQLDDVISAGGFTPFSARAFIEHSSSLPTEKALELNLKFARAINDGFIQNPIMPEQAAAMAPQ